MNIIVTGANGMLGGAICKSFSDKFNVYSLHKNRSCYINGINSFSVNLLHKKRLKKIFDEIDPNLVIHCASFTDVDKCEKSPDLAFDNNTITSQNLALLCKEKVKIIYISTDQVYGNSYPRTELNSHILPINKYGESKLLGEKIIEKNCRDHIIIRTNIFGWNINPNKTSSAEWMYKSLRNNKKINLYNDYYFSPIFTVDLCEIIKRLLYINFKGLINIGSVNNCSKYDFGIQLANLFGFDTNLILKTTMSNNTFFAKRPNNLSLDTSFAIKKNLRLPKWQDSVYNFYKSEIS